MSQENVEIVRSGWEALARRDTQTIEAFMRDHVAQDIEFKSVLTGRTYKGVKEAQELASDLWETLDYVPAIEEMIDAGEQVVEVLRIAGRGTRSGVPVSQQVAIVWTLEEQRIVRGESFTSQAEALEAAGLRE